MPPTAQFEYALTSMLNGWYRAECHYPGCPWFSDEAYPDLAMAKLRQHMRNHRIEVTYRKAVAE